MILNLTIKNYRSFKDETTFSMVAETSRSKEHSVFLQPLAKGAENVRLLNTAAIYGKNASGKSNLIRILFDVVYFITNSKPKIGERIKRYDPFKFCEETKDAPVEFALEFVGHDNIKYRYELHFDRNNVVYEELDYYPNKKAKNLLRRIFPEGATSKYHVGGYGKKKIDIFHNQAFLSKFGTDIPDKVISEVFLYVKNIEIVNATSSGKTTRLFKEITRLGVEMPELLKEISNLIKLADTQLQGIHIRKIGQNELKSLETNDNIPDDLKEQIVDLFKYRAYGRHAYYKNGELTGQVEFLPFEDESSGTRVIYSLGGKLLQVLNTGGVVFVDELDTSLHPFISKLLVQLFHDERINKNNAQLIFTTHDINLLDRNLLRKDQIWFTEKNERGESDLYSLQDFGDVREDTPFEKWYMAGKFGGIPELKSLQSLFEND